MHVLSDVVGRRVGIVRELQTRSPDAGDPRVWIANAELASCAAFFGCEPASGGGGAGLDLASASAAALGESAERYAAAARRLRGVETAPADERAARWRALIPAGVPFEPGETWGWARDERGAPVPAALVHMPYEPAQGERVRFVSASTGLAAGPTWHDASRSAFLEIVERDAVARAWYGRSGVRRLPLASAAPAAARAYEGSRVRARLFSLESYAALPTAFVIVDCVRASRRVVAVGSATRARWADAAAKALIEAAHSQIYVRRLVTGDEDSHWPPRTYQAHAAWPSLRPADWDAASRFLDQSPEGPAPEGVDLEAALTSAHPHLFDLTTPDLRAVEVAVARVVSPDFLPLPGDDRLRPISHPRWPLNPNPWPHPMP